MRRLLWGLLASVVLALVVVSFAVAAPKPGTAQVGLPSQVSPTTPPKPAPRLDALEAAGWADGTIAYGYTNECFNSFAVPLGGQYVGQFRNYPSSPGVGEVYYVRVGWSDIGNPCSGGMYAHVEVQLPSFTQLAITATNPVVCYFQGRTASNFSRFTNGCPQAPTSIGLYGGLSFDPAGGAWPTAWGEQYMIWIPVKTSRPLDGLIAGAGQGCPSCLFAGVWMIDGVFSPWTFSVQGIYVNDPTPPPAPAPYVDYPAPNHYQDPSVATTWWTAGFVYTEGTAGNIYTDIREGSGAFSRAGPSHVNHLAGGWRVDQPWVSGLLPGHTYQFRVCYDPDGTLAERCGALQTFKLPGGTDITPPTTTIVKKPPKFTNKTSALFTFSTNEVGSTFFCTFQAAGPTGCTAPIYSSLLQGAYTLAVFAKDAAGNSDLTPAVYSFTVDLTPPVTTFSSLTRSGRTATLRFRSNEPGTFRCKLDTKPWVVCASPKSFANLSSKLHKFQVKAVDRAGNQDLTPAVRTIRIP